MSLKSLTRVSVCAVVLCGLAIVGDRANAQQITTSVPLVLQDFSDCQNGNVSDPQGLLTRGTVFINKNSDGSISLKVGLTVQPKTTYHFFLKCVRQLGDVTTGEEGAGEAQFTIPANTVGNVFAFDVYPEGAPVGNKLQSMTVRLQ